MLRKYIIGAVALALAPVLASAQTAPLNPAPATQCIDFNMNLHMGAAGDPQTLLAIANLQISLVREGFTIDTTELGTFGASTKAAVKAFQEKYVDDVLAPFGMKKGTGYVGAVTRLKLQALYGCRAGVSGAKLQDKISLAVTGLNLDQSGVSATICNKGTNDLSTAPFRIRLNGINRDFEAIGAQKAGACTSDTWKYETWGLTFDPGSTFTAVTLLDPNGVYKTSQMQFPLSETGTLSVPVLPGAHLSVRSVLLKSTGLQATFCNLGTVVLNSFPVSVKLGALGAASTTKSFDIAGAYQPGKCVPMNWTYDNWGVAFVPGTAYTATVSVDPTNTYVETNEFDNVATVIGTP